MKDPILPPEPLPSSTAAVDAPGRAPTPGAALAGARVPVAPTLPEWDPASLSLVVQRLANELYQAPPGEPAVWSTSPQALATSGPMPTSSTAGTPTADLWGASAPVPHAAPLPDAIAPVLVDAPDAPAPAASNPAPVDVRAPAASSTTAPPVDARAPVGSTTAPPVDARAPVGSTTAPPEARAAPVNASAPLEAAGPGVPTHSTSPVVDSGPDAAAVLGGFNPFAVAPGFDFLDADAMRMPLLDPAPAPAHATTTAAQEPVAWPAHEVPWPEQQPPREPALRITPQAQHEPLLARQTQGFDAYALREEFPILQERVHGGKRLVWLDNAATTQKPQAVIDRLTYFYEHENSNIHRAAHALAARATDAYENARESVRRFINAPDKSDIVFVRGTTEGINLVAQTWGKKHIVEGDEILLTHLEHHANIVPWQMLANEKGAKLKVAPVDDDGQIILSEFERLLGPKVKLVSMPQVSNALGTITPAQQMIAAAHRYGAKVVLDGAQSVSHMKVDVQALDCDFFVFSGHKIFAPTGIGAVFGKRELLESAPPYQGGGNMIQDVTFERTVYQGPPAKFEAGTGNIADAVGLGAALDWVTRVGIENIDRHEHDLLVYATHRLRTVPGLRIYGTAKEKAGVISFTLDGHSTADVAAALDKEGIAVRGGHHCAQPILRRFGLESSVRASFAPYNVREDVDALVDALLRIQASSGKR